MEIAFNSSIDVLNKELEWLNKVISYRFAEYFKHSEQFDYPLAADLSSDESFYATILRKLEIDENSRLLILMHWPRTCVPQYLTCFSPKMNSSTVYLQNLVDLKEKSTVDSFQLVKRQHS
jgi:hypothetical protein